MNIDMRQRFPDPQYNPLIQKGASVSKALAKSIITAQAEKTKRFRKECRANNKKNTQEWCKHVRENVDQYFPNEVGPRRSNRLQSDEGKGNVAPPITASNSIPHLTHIHQRNQLMQQQHLHQAGSGGQNPMARQLRLTRICHKTMR
jgi:hypothetical protein